MLAGVISSAQNFVSYSGNNSTSTAYAIPYRFDAASWLVVGLQLDGETEPTKLELETDYTVDVDAGELVTVAAVPATATLTILRYCPALQTLSLENNAPLPAGAMEDQLDRMCMAIQDLYSTP